MLSRAALATACMCCCGDRDPPPGRVDCATPSDTALITAHDTSTTPGSDTTDTSTPPLGPGTCGDLASVFSLGGAGSDNNAEVAAGPDGSLFLGAMFTRTIVLGAGEPEAITLIPGGGAEVFVARYDPTGALSWAVQISSPESIYVEEMRPVVGGVVVAGHFYGSFSIQTSPPATFESTGISDMWLARFDEVGALVWATTAGGASADLAIGLAALSDDSVIAGGMYSGDATFGAGEKTETTLPIGSTEESAWLARYGTDGGLLWAQSISGTLFSRVSGIAAAASDAVSVVGSYSGPGSAVFGAGQPNETVLDPDVSEGFLAQWFPDGTLTNVIHFGTAFPERVDVGADGASMMSGQFYGTPIFGAGEPNETLLSANATREVFVSRHEPDLSLGWAVQSESASAGVGNGYGVVSTPDGGAVAVGYFTNDMQFGAGSPSETLLDSSGQGNYTAFAARYDGGGALVCALAFGGSAVDVGSDVVARPDGTYWLAAWFGSPFLRLDEGGPNETELASAGMDDMLVANYLF